MRHTTTFFLVLGLATVGCGDNKKKLTGGTLDAEIKKAKNTKGDASDGDYTYTVDYQINEGPNDCEKFYEKLNGSKPEYKYTVNWKCTQKDHGLTCETIPQSADDSVRTVGVGFMNKNGQFVVVNDTGTEEDEKNKEKYAVKLFIGGTLNTSLQEGKGNLTMEMRKEGSTKPACMSQGTVTLKKLVQAGVALRTTQPEIEIVVERDGNRIERKYSGSQIEQKSEDELLVRGEETGVRISNNKVDVRLNTVEAGESVTVQETGCPISVENGNNIEFVCNGGEVSGSATFPEVAPRS